MKEPQHGKYRQGRHHQGARLTRARRGRARRGFQRRWLKPMVGAMTRVERNMLFFVARDDGRATDPAGRRVHDLRSLPADEH
jgi:hypothetical protein